MPYQGDKKFCAWLLENEGAQVEVYIDPYRLEEATAITPDGDFHYLKASLSQFRHFSLGEWVHFLEEWRAADPLTKEVSVEALYRFYQRLKSEMDMLLEFHGKEHKVIGAEEAQLLADSLARGGFDILHGETSNNAAPLSALTEAGAADQGVYKPGDEVVEDDSTMDAVEAPTDMKTEQTERKPVKQPRSFTGTPAGKGKLK